MVSESTQAFANQILDSQFDFTIKCIIFACIVFYAILFYYLKRKTELDTFPKIVFSLFSSIYMYTTLLFLPLFSIMLFREYSAINLWTLLLQAYGVVFVIIALVLVFMGWQKVLDMFGIDSNIKMMRREQRRKGEE